MVNTCEIYGRTKTVDIHREPIVSVKKGKPISTPLLPSTKLRYSDAWPLTLASKDGPRLVIGTQSCNALVTSSLRLDIPGIGSVGGSTLSFLLNTVEDSYATKFFLDQESVKAAFDLALNTDAWSVSNQNILSQLRQLRSKFLDPSTYFLCRASGYITRSHTCHPHSVFTLANFIFFNNNMSLWFNNVMKIKPLDENKAKILC
ncbi:hypothetical protein EDD21DRAFT_344865 [Dissophora ornata]|nr:hypothetical protein EDD21DRAFT_344865 [Dissophora ornata]